jgi:hypothetical protein
MDEKMGNCWMKGRWTRLEELELGGSFRSLRRARETLWESRSEEEAGSAEGRMESVHPRGGRLTWNE